MNTIRHFATWWAGLSYSHSALVLLLVVTAIALIGTVLLAPGDEKDPWDKPSAPWPVTDYSKQYRDKVVWLGSRYLLHRPVNRPRPSSPATVTDLSVFARRQAN